jgi:hypothetical protein
LFGQEDEEKDEEKDIYGTVVYLPEGDDDDNNMGTIRFVEPSKESHLPPPSKDQNNPFQYRMPSVWELNIVALERGEFRPGMAKDAFRRMHKERPRLPKQESFMPPQIAKLSNTKMSISDGEIDVRKKGAPPQANTKLNVAMGKDREPVAGAVMKIGNQEMVTATPLSPKARTEKPPVPPPRQGPASRTNQPIHSFEKHSFTAPCRCAHCSKLIWFQNIFVYYLHPFETSSFHEIYLTDILSRGVGRQGYLCTSKNEFR